MPGPLLHVGAGASCMHLGTIALTTTNTRVFVNGAPVLTVADLPAQKVVGCIFQIPIGTGTKPQPCVNVQLVASARVAVNGAFALENVPAGGMCHSLEGIPQGPPILVTQLNVVELT